MFLSALSPRRTLALRAGLAPALLVAVAATQLLLVHTRELSAWKGGGFGMFSTVDSPLGRFYRVSLLTDSGEVRVAVPAELEPLAAAARTLPTPERLRRLGAVMAAGRWVPISVVRAEQRYRELHADRPADDLADPARPRAALPGDLPPGPGPLTFGVLRMQAPGEAPSPQAVAVRGVRVELWRTRFHPSSRTLRGSPLTSVTVPSPRR